MKTLFFGTGEVAAHTLEQLIVSPHEVVACVTTPDRAHGRGLEEQPLPVKSIAHKNGILCIEVEQFTQNIVDRIGGIGADIGVVVDFGRKIPSEVLSLPTQGLIGMHPSLLPLHRGAAPVQSALVQGDTVTGTTVFRVTASIDSGDILLQDMTTIHPDESAMELQDRLAHQGAAHVMHALNLLARGDVQWHPQEEAKATYTTKWTKRDGVIDWTQPAVQIVRRIRGLQPWPGTHTTWRHQRLKIYRGCVAVGCAVEPPGTVVQLQEDGFVVTVGEGGVLVTEVQLEGKRRMAAADFCRGQQLTTGNTLG